MHGPLPALVVHLQRSRSSGEGCCHPGCSPQAWNQYLSRQMLSSISAGSGECLSSAAAGGGRVESKKRLRLSIWYNPFLPSSMTSVVILSLESLTKCSIFQKDGLLYSRMALYLLCSQGWPWANYPLVVPPSLLLVGVYACATVPSLCGAVAPTQH